MMDQLATVVVVIGLTLVIPLTNAASTKNAREMQYRKHNAFGMHATLKQPNDNHHDALFMRMASAALDEQDDLERRLATQEEGMSLSLSMAASYSYAMATSSSFSYQSQPSLFHEKSFAQLVHTDKEGMHHPPVEAQVLVMAQDEEKAAKEEETLLASYYFYGSLSFGSSFFYGSLSFEPDKTINGAASKNPNEETRDQPEKENRRLATKEGGGDGADPNKNYVAKDESNRYQKGTTKYPQQEPAAEDGGSGMSTEYKSATNNHPDKGPLYYLLVLGSGAVLVVASVYFTAEDWNRRRKLALVRLRQRAFLLTSHYQRQQRHSQEERHINSESILVPGDNKNKEKVWPKMPQATNHLV